MSHFQEHGYEIVKGAVSKETLNLMTEYLWMKSEVEEYTGTITDDPTVSKCYCTYADILFDSLLLTLQSKLESVTQLSLIPAYSFARIYYKDADLLDHVDRPSCEISATLCVNQIKPWAIWMENYDGEYKPVEMDAGDMVVYRGNWLKHGRRKLEQDYHMQAFLHFVDANGIHTDQKFDKRPGLGYPEESKTY